MSASNRQEFCVRWNSHLGSIGAAFPQLLAGQRFVDVTLACEGHQVHCHRLVLAACSTYFESILAENPCKHPVIILPSEIKLWEIQALVDFMYKGEVNVTQAGLPQLLRCAEQLRIRGLYGSDAALNLNQLKALQTNKTSSNQTSSSTPGVIVQQQQQQQHHQPDSNDEDTATNSTTTTTATATSTIQPQQQQQQHQQQQQQHLQLPQQHNVVIKKEPINQSSSSPLLHNQQQQLIQHSTQQQQQQQLPMLTPASFSSMLMMSSNSAQQRSVSNAPTDDDSGDESTSNAYEQYENGQNINKALSANILMASQHAGAALDSTIEDDHNYVAAHEDDSFGGGITDTEHETSGNGSFMQNALDNNGSLRRIRRSEASLAQAAKCVSKGQTFQTVSNMFNIPVSTIRFYMARKGILPKRKRGRGASTTGGGVMSSMSSGAGAGAAANAAVVMSQLARFKRSDSPNSAAQYADHLNLMGYKMEQGAAHLI